MVAEEFVLLDADGGQEGEGVDFFGSEALEFDGDGSAHAVADDVSGGDFEAI